MLDHFISYRKRKPAWMTSDTRLTGSIVQHPNKGIFNHQTESTRELRGTSKRPTAHRQGKKQVVEWFVIQEIHFRNSKNRFGQGQKLSTKPALDQLEALVAPIAEGLNSEPREGLTRQHVSDQATNQARPVHTCLCARGLVPHSLSFEIPSVCPIV